MISQGRDFRDYQRQIREKERGMERNLVPLISGTRSVLRSSFEKKERVPVPFLKLCIIGISIKDGPY